LRTRQFRAGTDETTAAEVVADLIALRRVLLQNRFQLDDARTAWEMSRLRRLAEDARGDLALGAGVELQQALLDIDEQEKTLTALRSVFGPALHRVARGEAEGGRMRELLPNGPRAVYATRLADREFGAAVFEVDLVRLRTVLLPEILAALPLPEEVEATVLDSTGAPIVAGVVRPHGPVLAEDRLAEALPFWRAAVFLRDPSAAVRRTSSARRLHYGVMGVAIAGMLAAGWFVLRTVRSELKVAQMKSDFLSNITHELKTPLTSIRMFIETLQEGRVTDEAERNECLSVIAHESDRLSGLIQRVLDLSRFEGGKRPLSRETTDLGALVEDAAGIFRRRLGDSDVAFEVDIERDLPPVEIEPAPIQEVVLNLLSNALKYGSTRILLSARAVAGDAVLTVEDDGIGIAEDEQERIFEKFHRAEDTLARAVEGTGLGLALVREIVRAHGGRVGVTSTKGEGSRFTVRLPLGGN
jgi:signal transduction histidine kinase